MRVNGPSRRHLDQLGDDFAALVERGIDQAARVATKDLKLTWTGDDLAVIQRVFDRYALDTLVPELARQYEKAIQDQADRVAQAALSVTAAIVLPSPPDILAEQYLSTATNRLKGISDEVWQQTRTELTVGMQAGESIPQLRKRVMAAADVSKKRATVIARTEVIGAQNRGSLGQMMATGYAGTKDWLATSDHRTRLSHAAMLTKPPVRLTEKFTVGGHPMDGPHDPSAPPGETISCRCTLTYEIDDTDVRASETELGTGLNPDQYALLDPKVGGPAMKRSERMSNLATTSAGRNVRDALDSFSAKRGGVANLRAQIQALASGEKVSDAIRDKITDFLGAVNNWPVDRVPKLYRGMIIKTPTAASVAELEARYAVGKTIDMNVSSFTSDLKTAREYHTYGNTLHADKPAPKKGNARVRITVAGKMHALPIEKISEYKLEREWIGGGTFKVVGFKAPAGNRDYYDIVIEQAHTLTPGRLG